MQPFESDVPLTMRSAPLSSVDSNDPDLARQHATRRSTVVSVVVNLMLTTAQVIVGWLAGSQALIADGLHSLSDLISDAVVLLANAHSHRGPDDDHHYGHYRYETAAALVVGGLLIVTGLALMVAATQKLASSTPLSNVHPIALWVALAALLSKGFLFRYLLSIARRVRSTLLAANAWHAWSDAASSFVVAIGIAGNLWGWHFLDPIAALIVGLMVLKMGGKLAWCALDDLMDAATDQASLARIREILLSTPGVQGLHALRTRKMADLILVDVHLEIDADLTVAQGHSIAEQARSRVMSALPVLDVMTHVDPVATCSNATNVFLPDR